MNKVGILDYHKYYTDRVIALVTIEDIEKSTGKKYKRGDKIFIKINDNPIYSARRLYKTTTNVQKINAFTMHLFNDNAHVRINELNDLEFQHSLKNT